MPRNPVSLVQRFADVVPLWAQAEVKGGLRFTVLSESSAINTVYRLNQYRKLLRGKEDEGITSLDDYVVRRNGATIEIAPRPVFDISMMTTLDGRPITPLTVKPKPTPLDEIAKKYLNMDPNERVVYTTQEQIEVDKAAAVLRREGLFREDDKS